MKTKILQLLVASVLTLFTVAAKAQTSWNLHNTSLSKVGNEFVITGFPPFPFASPNVTKVEIVFLDFMDPAMTPHAVSYNPATEGIGNVRNQTVVALPTVTNKSYVPIPTGLAAIVPTDLSFSMVIIKLYSNDGRELELNYTFGAGSGILPVELSSFGAETNGDVVNLKWSTASEQNTHKFIVQYSSDGVNYIQLGEVAAAGNSSLASNYSFTTTQADAKGYYLLKMLDLDGTFEYSNVVVVDKANAEVAVTIFPNPVTVGGDVTLQFANGKRGIYNLQLFNAAGSLLFQKNSNVSGQFFTEKFALPKQVNAGVYFLKVANQQDGTQKTIRLVVN